VSAPRKKAAPLSESAAQFLDALGPVASALGARIVGPDTNRAGDVPLHWDGELVGRLRPPNLDGALHRLINAVERELGGSLETLSREDKQRAVKLLEDRGAFVMRKAVEEVADALHVSRITIYNYLNAIRG
jgi:hypothetical protein